MFNLVKGIDSLTNFKRQTADYLARLHKTGEPLVLTVNGKAEVVVQEKMAAIRDGLADVAAGRTKSARIALKALAKKYDVGSLEPAQSAQKSTRRGRQVVRKST
jgi:PHD/YefM family antitoxin component YafN of YafNO toxin-antitoxin module